VDREIIVPNLLYCSNFSYYCPPTWSRGGWQSRWLPTEVHLRPFDPSNLPWAVSQCPFDPYWAGVKVYQAYRAGGQAGGPPHRQPCQAYAPLCQAYAPLSQPYAPTTTPTIQRGSDVAATVDKVSPDLPCPRSTRR
jgi:hypothetical protein